MRIETRLIASMFSRMYIVVIERNPVMKNIIIVDNCALSGSSKSLDSRYAKGNELNPKPIMLKMVQQKASTLPVNTTETSPKLTKPIIAKTAKRINMTKSQMYVEIQ